MIYQKITMWIKNPDDWDELAIDELIRDTLLAHGIEVIESLPYEEDGLYSDEDFENKEECQC